jgi:succinoglycan biosynthesis transport protein ExoP
MSTHSFRSVGSSTSWPWTIRRNILIVTTRLPLFAMIALVALAAALTVDRVYPKTYTSNARLLTEPYSTKSAPFDSPGSPLVNEVEFMQTQVEVVKSSLVMGKVVDELHLGSRLDDLSTPLDQVSAVTEDAETRLGFKLPPPDAAFAQKARAIDLLSHRTTPKVIRDTFVLEINVSTRDPKLSQRITTSVVAAYLQVTSDTRLQQMKASDKVLTQQIADAAQRVKSAETRLADFDAANGTAVSSTQTSTSGATSTSPSSSSTVTEPGNRVARSALQSDVAAERTRLATLNTTLDSLKVNEAAVESRSVPTQQLDAPVAATASDGIGLKYRFLIYLLAAPLLGILACYVAQSMEDYRRVLTPVRAKGA